MSFRMYVKRTDNENMQIFGNNDVPTEMFDALYKQGLPEFEDCFDFFEIKELQPIVDVMVNDLLKRAKNYKDNYEEYKLLGRTKGVSLFDFTNVFSDENGNFITDHIYFVSTMIIENYWAFHLYRFIEFLHDDIDWEKSSSYRDKFVLKEDAHVSFDFG